jgi:alcohol dehydrogenase class IV
VVVAIGGGTAIDIAKIVASCFGAGTSPGDSFPDTFDRPPLLAIPTTAGTGAEATHFAVMYENGIKKSIAHAQIRPDAALVDSSLSFTAPRRVAASSGFDALCQAYESLLSRKATPRSKLLATSALDLLRGGLEAAIIDRNSQAHADVARGAYLSGCAIDISFTNAVHALSYPLTSRLGIPHGEALAILFPYVMDAMGVDDPVATEIVKLRDRLELPKAVEKEFPPEAFAAEISIERLENAPGQIDRAGIEWIYRSCIASA